MKKRDEQKEIERLRREVDNLNTKLKQSKSLKLCRENPEEWENTEEARDLAASLAMVFGDRHALETYFPQDYKKRLPEDGGWIRINEPPPTQITVPPFSMWFAVPWSMERERNGLQAKRVKITTPSGDLGIMPHEYCAIDDITQWLGREGEGVFVRQMNGNTVVNTDHLFYLMSRGVKRSTAMLMLISTIKDPTFLWFEIAPQYGEYFGKDWPDPKLCPFATPRDQFIADAESLLTAR